MKLYLSEILYLLGNDRSKLPLMLLLFLAISILELAGLGLVVPYISLVLDPQALDGNLGRIVEIVGLPKEQGVLLVYLGGALVGIFLLKTIAAIWINRAIIIFSLNRQMQLRTTLMQRFQNLPYTEYLRRNSSEYIHSIQQLTAQYAIGVVNPILRLLSDGVVAMVIIGFLAWTNGSAVALMVILFSPVIFGYDRLFRTKLRAYGQKANDAARGVVQGVQEGVEGLKEIRVLGKEHHFHSKVHACAENYATNYIRSQVISTVPRYLFELLLITFIVLLVIMTLRFNGNLETIAPVLALFGVAALRLLPMISTFSSSLTQLRYNRHAVSQLYDDLKQMEHIPSDATMVSDNVTGDPFRKLVLEGVQFHYPNTERKALDDISLEIHAGESIGLIGASGSGKTTLVDVLLGLLEPQHGKIRYNDKPLHDVLGDWRSQVAYLPQQVFLIDNSLRCNVALGVNEDEIDDVRLQDALLQARLKELIDQLPHGVDTLLGERGVRLSGGQRQRVALARAFYHGRNVLVMDEATSALDNETEREIVAEIQRLKGNKTMIIIAHRLTTVQHSHRIYKLDNGRIVETGTSEQVLPLHKNLAV